MDSTKPGGLTPEQEGKDALESASMPVAPESVQESFVVPETPLTTEQEDQMRQEHIIQERQGIAETIQEQGVAQAQPAQNQVMQAPRVAQKNVVASITIETLQTLSPEDQVATLVTIAHSEGLEHAFALAKKTNNAYVIDRFHDTLVNNIIEFKNQHGGGGQ